MSAPVQSCQPIPEPVRRDPPVCCYCDHDLSCDHCGMEQPYTDVSVLKARIQELESNALEQAKLLADTGRRVENLGPSRSSLLNKIAATIDAALSSGEAGK